jgi:hypothetical protein
VTLITPSRYSRGEDFTGAAAVAESLPALAQRNGGGKALTVPDAILEAVRAVHRECALTGEAARGLTAAE